MTDFILSPDAVLWSTLWVSVASLLALVVLRGVQSPTVHRLTCVVILLQGWIWWRCDCPVLPASESESAVASHQPLEATHSHPDSAAAQDADVLATVSVEPATVDLGLMEAAIFAIDHSTSATATASAPSVDSSSRPASSQPLAAAAINWSRWLLSAWICGMLATAVIWLMRYVSLQRKLPAVDELPEEYQSQWRDVCARTGLSTAIPLWGLANLGPACGLMKGRCVVFVPTERWPTFSVEQRWAILLHEAAHLCRGDLWRSLFIRLLALPQWFNPLAWRMVRRFDEAAEWACDEFVLQHQASCGPEFAEALLSLTVKENLRLQFSAAANGHPLSERVRRLLSPHPSERTMIKRSLLIAVLALCTIANFVRLSAQEAEHADPLPATAVSGDAAFAEDVATSASANEGASAVETTDGGTVLLGGIPEHVEAAQPAESEVFSFSVGFDDGPTTSNDAVPAVVDGSEVQADAAPADVRPVEEPAGIDFAVPALGPGVMGPGPSVASEASQSPPFGTSPNGDMPHPGDLSGESSQGSRHTEAVIDMSEVFRQSDYFASETARIKAEITQLKEQMEDMQARLQVQQRLLNETEGDRHDELQRQTIELQVEIEVLTSKSQARLRDAEAAIYLNTYRRVRTVIAEYARENGIQTVRRVRSSVSEEDMDAQAVLELINRDIVYSADEPRDITQDIIDRLNAPSLPSTTSAIYQPGAVGYPADATPPAYALPPTQPGPSTNYGSPSYGQPTPTYQPPSAENGVPSVSPPPVLPPQPETTPPADSGTPPASVPSAAF